MNVGQDPSGRKQNARRQISAGQFEAAIWTLRELLANDPADAESHAMLGAAISMNGDPSGSLRHLEEAAFLDPERAAYQYNLGYAHEQEGNAEAAQGAYERALRIDPHYERAADSLRRLTTRPAVGVQISAGNSAPVVTTAPLTPATPLKDPTPPPDTSSDPASHAIQSSFPVAPVAEAPLKAAPTIPEPRDSVIEPAPPPHPVGQRFSAVGAAIHPGLDKPQGSSEPTDTSAHDPAGALEPPALATVEIVEPAIAINPIAGNPSDIPAANVPTRPGRMPSVVRALRAINVLWIIVGASTIGYGFSATHHPAGMSVGGVHIPPVVVLLFGAVVLVLNGLSFVGAGRRSRRTWDLGFLVGLLGLIGGPFGLVLWLFLLGKWFLPETKAWFRMRSPHPA